MEHEMSLDMLGSAVVSSGKLLILYFQNNPVTCLTPGMTAVLPSSMQDCVSSPHPSLHPAMGSMYQSPSGDTSQKFCFVTKSKI